MGDEFDYHRNNLCNSGKWWDSTSRNRFETPAPPSTTTTTTTTATTSSTGIRPSWNNITSSMDSNSGSAGTSHSIFQDESSGGGVLINNDPHSNLQMMMGLGLNSQPMDWNQHALLRSVKGEGSFGSFVHEDQQINMNPTTNFHQQGSTSNPSNFQMDHQGTASSSIYETSTPSPSTILHGFYVPNQQQQQQQQESSFENQNRSLDYPNYMVNYDVINPNNEVLLPNTKFSHFMGNSSGSTNSTSPPKQQVFAPSQYNQLQFSNVAPFWNASATVPAATNAMSDHAIPMSFLPSSLQQQQQQPQYTITPNFDEKSIKSITSEAKASGLGVKKSSSETSMKRPRNEASSSPLPPFKEKKEKTTDRVTALQQLVSPFGKTDQASVFTATIECIQFYHDQLAVLTTPYKKSGASNQQHHRSHQPKDPEGRKQDLKSRGLCLVPVSSIFPSFQETPVDYWTPTYGGTYR